MSAGDFPPGASPGDPTAEPDGDWRPPLPSPPPPWTTGTFASELSRLLRRLAVWHITDFMSPVQTIRSGGEFWQLTSRTFRDLIQGFGDLPLRAGYRLFTDDDGRGAACLMPERETDRTATQWLLAVFFRRLEAAPALPAFDYLRGVFNQLLALPAWEGVPADEIGMSGQPEGTRLLSGRPVPEALRDDLRRAVKWLQHTPQAAAPEPTDRNPTPEDRQAHGVADEAGGTGDAPPHPTPAEILARVRDAGDRTHRLAQTIEAARAQDERVRQAVRSLDDARGHIYEAREAYGRDFDAAPYLAAVEAALVEFSTAALADGRGDRLDQLNMTAVYRELRVGLNADETAAAYDWAVCILRTALNGRPVGEMLREGWDGPDRAGRSGLVLQTAVQCLTILANLLAGGLGFKREPLDAAEALALARTLRDRYGRFDAWTPTDLSRACFDLGTLDLALERMHVALPRPHRWGDTALEATDKLNRIVGALEGLVQSAGPGPEAPKARSDSLTAVAAGGEIVAPAAPGLGPSVVGGPAEKSSSYSPSTTPSGTPPPAPVPHRPRLPRAQSEALEGERLARSLGGEGGCISCDSTDEEVFDWLMEHKDDDRVRQVLPASLPAFKKALTRARSNLKVRKRRPPAAPTGKSVVRQGQVEPPGREDD